MKYRANMAKNTLSIGTIFINYTYFTGFTVFAIAVK